MATGFVFALKTEAYDFLQTQRNMRRVREKELQHLGKWFASDETVVVICGVGEISARRATEKLLQHFSPTRVISAGFAGGLRPLSRGVYAVNRVTSVVTGETIEIETHEISPRAKLNFTTASLLTTPEIISSPKEKLALGEKYAADLVDMETFAVVDVCKKNNVTIECFRILFDNCDEEINGAIARVMLAAQNGFFSLAPALFSLALKNPAAFIALNKLRHLAKNAGGELAKVLENVK